LKKAVSSKAIAGWFFEIWRWEDLMGTGRNEFFLFLNEINTFHIQVVAYNTDYKPVIKMEGTKNMLRFGNFYATFGYFLATFVLLFSNFWLLLGQGLVAARGHRVENKSPAFGRASWRLFLAQVVLYPDVNFAFV